MSEKKNRQEYQHLIDKLRRERQRIVDTAQDLLSQSMRDSLDELSLVDNHPADIGTEMYMRERDVALRDRYMSQIAAIDAALERWEEGRYGICERCGAEIPMERLEILPYTTLCTKCSREEEIEEKHSFNRQPVENELLNHPFARSFRENGFPTGFDGEDAWQAVAQYGTADSLQDLGTNADLSDASFNFEDSDELVGAISGIEALEVEKDDGLFYDEHHGRSSRHVRPGK